MRVTPVLSVFLVLLAGFVTESAGQAPGGTESVWRSARYHGGSDFEFAERLAVDAQGNAFMLGRTYSTDMHAAVAPVASGRGEQASATFVLKLGRDGLPLYAVPVGTGFSFLPLDIAVGADGSAHVLARDGDFTHVVKIDASGTQFLYHVTLNGLDRDAIFPAAIGVDDAGHTVIAGASHAGLFVARLDARGNVFDLHTVPVRADVRDLAIDHAGDAYMIGAILGDGLPTTAGALQPRYHAGACGSVLPPLGGPAAASPCPDAFVVKMTRTGNLAYATYFGGTGWDEGTTIAVDRSGAAIIAGLTRSTDLPLARAFQTQCHPGFAPLPCGDAFVAKLDPAGASLVFSTYVGGNDTEVVNGIAVDAAGAVYVGGAITGTGLQVQRAPQSSSGGGGSDGFVVAFAPTGALLWSTYVGGAQDERVVGVGVSSGMVVLGGETTSPGWAVGGAGYHGARDLFSAGLFDPAAP